MAAADLQAEIVDQLRDLLGIVPVQAGEFDPLVANVRDRAKDSVEILLGRLAQCVQLK